LAFESEPGAEFVLNVGPVEELGGGVGGGGEFCALAGSGSVVARVIIRAKKARAKLAPDDCLQCTFCIKVFIPGFC